MMGTKLTASRSLVRNAALALDNKHKDTVSLCAMAKMFATENCFEVQLNFNRPAINCDGDIIIHTFLNITIFFRL